VLMNLPRARALMARDGLDAIIGARSENFIYLTGYVTDTEAHILFGHAVEREPERDYHAVLPPREDVRPTCVCTAIREPRGSAPWRSALGTGERWAPCGARLLPRPCPPVCRVRCPMAAYARREPPCRCPSASATCRTN
jgi:hypothetical protein